MRFLDPGDPAGHAERVREGFAAAFGRPPQLVGRAPGRVNLIGEHTDYNRGRCLPVALPHATYAALAPRTDTTFRLVSAQSDHGWEGDLADVGPGRPPGWPAYVAGVGWALREHGLPVTGVDCYLDSTVPVGAGLSSSAAVECSVAVGLAELLGRVLDDDLRAVLVAACIRAETEVAGAPTGGLDQSVSLFAREGQALLLDFDDGGRRHVPVDLAADGMALVVIDTRVSHALVDGGYAARRADCEEAARRLGLPSLRRAALPDLDALDDERLRRRARHVVTEIERVGAAVPALVRRDWAEVGRLFAASHASLRDDYDVSCAELDLAVATAEDAGALGARMTGGGFGGSAVAVVPAQAVEEVAGSVARAFSTAGFAAPAFLRAIPSGGAGIVE